LGLAKPYPFADARQVLQGDPATGAFSLGHHIFRDLVVDVLRPPRLLTPPLLQTAFGGRGVLRTGIGMLLLGIFFLAWLKLRPTPPTVPEVTDEDLPDKPADPAE
jgi:hypothetical protein